VVNDRLRVVFDDLQRAVADVTVKHAVTESELNSIVQWIVKAVEAGELPLAAIMLFGYPVQEANYGKAYANHEKDGASPWTAAGPAYLPGAPHIDNPGVLPMAPDEPGDVLFVSGVVRSISGEPLAGALLDLWQTNHAGHYSGLTPETAGPLHEIVDLELPPHILRGKIVTDEAGRYEYRTVVPGLERLADPGSMIDSLMVELGRVNERPRHIHSFVSREGYHMLTHQIHFEGDPRVDHVAEGAVPTETVLRAQLHDDPADYTARGLAAPYRTLTCNYVLRPVGSGAAADPAHVDGYWNG
jgi:catechol 1,2-dioxygenase